MLYPGCLISLLILLAPCLLPGANADSAAADEKLLADAEQQFAKGRDAKDDPARAHAHFTRAAALLAELQRRGIRNESLFGNLGNAELLAGNIGAAILAYRQGLRLDPGNARLRDGLEFARSRVHYPEAQRRPAEPSWPVWLPYPSVLFMGCVAFIVYVLANLAWVRRLIKGHGTPLAVSLLAAAVLAGAASTLLDRQDSWEEHNPLVVIALDKVPLRRGNSDSYPQHDELPLLSEGMEARRLHQRGDWLQIRLPGGEIGWVERRFVLSDAD